MLGRKEGLEPKIGLIEVGQWTTDCASSERPENGFGIVGYTYKAIRRRWWKSGRKDFYRGEPPVLQFSRPIWKKEIVECWKMLNLTVTIWSRVYNINVRLGKTTWTEPTKYS